MLDLARSSCENPVLCQELMDTFERAKAITRGGNVVAICTCPNPSAPRFPFCVSRSLVVCILVGWLFKTLLEMIGVRTQLQLTQLLLSKTRQIISSANRPLVALIRRLHKSHDPSLLWVCFLCPIEKKLYLDYYFRKLSDMAFTMRNDYWRLDSWAGPTEYTSETFRFRDARGRYMG